MKKYAWVYSGHVPTSSHGSRGAQTGKVEGGGEYSPTQEDKTIKAYYRRALGMLAAWGASWRFDFLQTHLGPHVPSKGHIGAFALSWNLMFLVVGYGWWQGLPNLTKFISLSSRAQSCSTFSSLPCSFLVAKYWWWSNWILAEEMCLGVMYATSKSDWRPPRSVPNCRPDADCMWRLEVTYWSWWNHRMEGVWVPESLLGGKPAAQQTLVQL